MDPIISPLFIYLLSLVDPAISIFTCLSVLCIIALLIFGLIYAITMQYPSDLKVVIEVWHKSKPKLWILLGVLSLFLAVVVPSRDTVIAMYAANKITYNNTQKAVDAGKTIKDELKKDVLDIIQAIQKGKAEKK